MIEPVRSGHALLEEIHDTDPCCGTMAAWWLGQSGFLLKSGGVTVLVDPYLSEHLTTKYAESKRPHVRMTRAPLRGADLSGVDVILASHKHSDHLDPGTVPDLLAASPNAKLVLPASLVEYAEGLGLPADRLVGLVAGERFTMPGLSVKAIPSAHEGLDTDAAGRHLYLGYLIELGGLRAYHSGDTLAYEGLETAVGPGPVDVMFLPVNGRDPARGVAGNMTADEAVTLASRVGPRYVVPHHYDMFTFNTVPVSAFRDAARHLASDVRPKVLACGERWELRR
ncbi:MAG: MBL fold metallo-hydrolase [Isosphaeraceae bacterium]